MKSHLGLCVAKDDTRKIYIQEDVTHYLYEFLREYF